jgi:hypothetical protein
MRHGRLFLFLAALQFAGAVTPLLRAHDAPWPIPPGKPVTITQDAPWPIPPGKPLLVSKDAPWPIPPSRR